jgi:hypothetical protein
MIAGDPTILERVTAALCDDQFLGAGLFGDQGENLGRFDPD